MKINCIIHSLNGGGAERVMAGLVTRLQQRGHCVTLITLDDGCHDRHDVCAEVKRISLNVMCESPTKLAALFNVGKRVRVLRQAIRDSQADTVLSFCDATNVLTLLATRGLAIPVVVSERSDPDKQSLAWPWSSLRPKLYRHAAAVIVLTDTVAKTVTPWCQNQPVVIPSAVDSPPPLDRGHLAHRSEKVLLGIGRLEHEKGFDRLIAAFAQVASRFPDWKLRIVGEGSLRKKLEQQVVSLGISDRVTFPGWQQPIWPELADADLFVLTSRYEGFPSALLEAMAAGVACLAVDCESGPRAIVQNEVDGLLVGNDEASIAQALERCLGNDLLRQQLGIEAVKVIDRFGWDSMVDAYEACLISEAQKQ